MALQPPGVAKWVQGLYPSVRVGVLPKHAIQGHTGSEASCMLSAVSHGDGCCNCCLLLPCLQELCSAPAAWTVSTAPMYSKAC